jgi:ketosteroid isomerase-like protein
MASDEMEQRVRGLADREAIRELPLRYCDCVWRQDAAGIAALYTEDGSFDFGLETGSLEGSSAIRDFFVATFETTQPLPFIHNHVFEVDGDVASGRCSVEIRLGEDTSMGVYHDNYARVDGQWRFRSRKATMLTPLPA